MNQRLPLSDIGSSANDTALYWLARRMSGSMNAEERREFENWLAADPENRKAFSNAEVLVSRVDKIGDELLAQEFEKELSALS